MCLIGISSIIANLSFGAPSLSNQRYSNPHPQVVLPIWFRTIYSDNILNVGIIISTNDVYLKIEFMFCNKWGWLQYESDELDSAGCETHKSYSFILWNKLLRHELSYSKSSSLNVIYSYFYILFQYLFKNHLRICHFIPLNYVNIMQSDLYELYTSWLSP